MRVFIWTKQSKKKKSCRRFRLLLFFFFPATFEITPVMGWAAVALPPPISKQQEKVAASLRRFRRSCGAPPDCPGMLGWRPRRGVCVCVWWHRLCSKARLWSTCSSGTAGWTGSAGSSSASGERRRSSSRSGRNGRTGTFYTCTGVTPTWVGCSEGCWNLSQRTGETCPRALR